MTECCTPRPRQSEQRCAPEAQAAQQPVARPAKASCPASGDPGKPVEPITLEHLLTAQARMRLLDAPYYFCRGRSCDVVYFTASAESTFTKADLTVPVTQKDPGDSVPVCYCFGHTRASIYDEIRRTGTSTVVADITHRVQAGECACERTNPQGSCCLGNVSQAVKHGLAFFTTVAATR